MKRIIVVFVLICLLSSACGDRRDLSTPSSRLVGHWESPFTNREYYIGEIDPTTSEGKWTVYNQDTGFVTYCSYMVLRQAPEGEEIFIDTEYIGGGSTCGGVTIVAKDGLSASTAVIDGLLGHWAYIDDKTEYESIK